MKKYLLFSVMTAAAACAVYAQAPAEEQKAAPAIKVEKLVTSASVEKREPVGETSSFDRTASQVCTWNKIAAEQVPVKIKHVYYLNDKKVREIELNVTTTTWRGWTVKNVTPGNWKVEVTDAEGKVLAAAVFTVAGAAAAETGK